jgi:hypothetical protein
MRGARGAFHLPVRQAILRSEAYLNVRCNKPAPCLTRGRMRGTPQMGVFQQPLKSWPNLSFSNTLLRLPPTTRPGKEKKRKKGRFNLMQRALLRKQIPPYKVPKNRIQPTVWLAQNGFQVIGTDSSDIALEKAKRKSF